MADPKISRNLTISRDFGPQSRILTIFHMRVLRKKHKNICTSVRRASKGRKLELGLVIHLFIGYNIIEKFR